MSRSPVEEIEQQPALAPRFVRRPARCDADKKRLGTCQCHECHPFFKEFPETAKFARHRDRGQPRGLAPPNHYDMSFGPDKPGYNLK